MIKFIPFTFIIASFINLAIANEKVVWVDVRSESEFKVQHVAGSRNIPHDKIGHSLHLLPKDKTIQINLYCRSGRRSNIAKLALTKLGFSNVHDKGGLDDLKRARLKLIEW